MGMMNNPWFRVKIHDSEAGQAHPGPPNGDGKKIVWFEHPTCVEKNLRTSWDLDKKYKKIFQIQGKTGQLELPSAGWMRRQKVGIVMAFIFSFL